MHACISSTHCVLVLPEPSVSVSVDARSRCWLLSVHVSNAGVLVEYWMLGSYWLHVALYSLSFTILAEQSKAKQNKANEVRLMIKQQQCRGVVRSSQAPNKSSRVLPRISLFSFSPNRLSLTGLYLPPLSGRECVSPDGAISVSGRAVLGRRRCRALN